MPDFPTEWIREQFPALNDGEEFVFFDNGAGAQVPQVVLDAVRSVRGKTWRSSSTRANRMRSHSV